MLLAYVKVATRVSILYLTLILPLLVVTYLLWRKIIHAYRARREPT